MLFGLVHISSKPYIEHFIPSLGPGNLSRFMHSYCEDSVQNTDVLTSSIRIDHTLNAAYAICEQFLMAVAWLNVFLICIISSTNLFLNILTNCR